ncbi:Clan CA, family C19, ubiquitin hydrolase-like cysteine peptidase [Trichomonas vaginalis G3]|uniref:ubiquitinyl hydrolase 1 n=1 Tax=Trichomonas vaginalis (strain ATCC PRA-98 / G3) TaxID=412133 RepID=A2FGV9_TRIV3|nr:ubiquitinyl hydrolase protein [Trichomonas vaginalis G3]XP_051079279.1 ubiquitinyl hydrolase protein [Trichomonas vaginalis G3]EAX95863.1 Clan CA, family C19, ubiquitin hydrolase-like cysteine peptidase [Trichomonas vaginalis G3]KAI5488649.1 ubiquitinyl hydrolase protein [Trichomonas vaginalis G3]KAI5488681.1 ubiquitinyl hydrolase protein [Trichomonas vaginalis G3]|eukprot:XP_001308793.1 Clan CA, family C19, ubiquitin hydrolase-like cysteine peptidase [Trichomonas vaginalis G3]
MRHQLSSIFESSGEGKFDPHLPFGQFANFFPPGLGNPGNLCYLNSLIQTFASSVQWRNFFEKCPKTNPILAEINEILNSLSRPLNGNTIISTKSLRKQLQKAGLTIDPTIQTDIHEFYTLFIEIIENQLMQKLTSPTSAFATRRIFPTHCIYEETITCPICNSSTSRIDQTSTFILDVTSGSLNNALQEYFGPITIQSKCTHCNRMTDRKLRRSILFLPRSILFFLTRNVGIGRPINQEFEFPEWLDITNYSLVPLEEVKEEVPLMRGSLSGISEIQDETSGFRLTSVSAFLGSDNAGHYFTYRQHFEEGGLRMRRWVKCSDSTVTVVPRSEVFAAKRNSILLHYELVH